MYRERYAPMWLTVGALITAAAACYGQQPATFDAPQSTQTNITGINPEGSFVGYYTDTNRKQHGFVVVKGTFTSIDAPGTGPAPFAISQALAINARGDIVALYANIASGQQQYYVLSRGRFNPIQITGAEPGSIVVAGISNTGDLVGTYAAGGKQHGFLLSGGTLTNVDVPGAQMTFAHGINSQGDIVGWYTMPNSFQTQGFLLSHGLFTTLDMAGASATELMGVASTGQIVGACVPLDSCEINDAAFSTIPVPNSRNSGATGISNNGTVVGWYNDTGAHQHGYILTPAQ